MQGLAAGGGLKILIINFSIFFSESLGRRYGEASILDLEATWAESEPRTPLICILSIGSDPSPQILNLSKAKDLRMCSNLIFLCINFFCN